MSQPQAMAILEPAATRVRDPVSGRSVWLAEMITEANIHDDTLSFTLIIGPKHRPDDGDRLREALLRNLEHLGWKGAVNCLIQARGGRVQVDPGSTPGRKDAVRGMSGPGVQPHGGPFVKKPITGVKHIVAVASGKGGVGKSTIATNLAVALNRKGYAVGLMDADIYGPSLPTMMNVHGKPLASADKKVIPLEGHGVRCMSIGFLVDAKEPIIWRGPMVMSAVRQFLHDVDWGELDVLVIDLPPGTGDAQLTMVQTVPLSGAVIVTTPQEVAVVDAVRGIEMFRKLDVTVLGLVENMAWFELPDGSRAHPFGQDGGARTATEYEIPLLARVPLDERIRAGGDAGTPVAATDEDGTDPFTALAESVATSLGL